MPFIIRGDESHQRLFMNRNRLFQLLLVVALAFAGAAFALLQGESDVEKQMSERLSKVFPDMSILKISPTPIAGLYEVRLDIGGNNIDMVYMTASGEFFFTGDLVQLSGDQVVNLSEQKRGKERSRLLAEQDSSLMVSFKPEGKVKAQVYVFTDVDCGYCRELHQEMAAMNSLGIQVNYLAYPRAGIDSGSAAKLDAVWCSENPQEAMTRAKNGIRLAPAPSFCQSPVAAQYKLGGQLQVRGTPAIFTESGEKVGGYMKAEELAQILGL